MAINYGRGLGLNVKNFSQIKYVWYQFYSDAPKFDQKLVPLKVYEELAFPLKSFAEPLEKPPFWPRNPLLQQMLKKGFGGIPAVFWVGLWRWFLSSRQNKFKLKGSLVTIYPQVPLCNEEVKFIKNCWPLLHSSAGICLSFALSLLFCGSECTT